MKDKLKQLLIELVHWQNENTPKPDRVDFTFSQILTLIKSNMPKKIENIIETCCTCDCYKSGRNKGIDDCIKVMGL